MKICRSVTYDASGRWMVIRLLTVSTAHALPASRGLESIGSGRRPAPLVSLRCTHHAQMDESEGVEEKEKGILAEVLQYSGAKWGDRDNDNVRSALASGLLRLMDALIISKQELQWFAHIKLVPTIIVHFRSETTREKKILKDSRNIWKIKIILCQTLLDDRYATLNI